MTRHWPSRLTHVPTGVALAAAVACAAHRRGWLSRDGAMAAVLVGGAVYAGTGIRGSAGMLAFFATSSLLGRLPSAASIPQRRGNARDAIQVLANGGIPALLALAVPRIPASSRPLVYTAYGGAIAAAAADTWATELGSRFGRNPRSLRTLQPIPAGASGAVSLAGLLASAAGAVLVAVLLSRPFVTRYERQARAMAIGGAIGSLVDSWCGAAWQEIRYCDACQCATEALLHTCGHRTRHLRGHAWLNNDAVNVIAVAAGAVAAIALHAVDRDRRSLA